VKGLFHQIKQIALKALKIGGIELVLHRKWRGWATYLHNF